MRPPIVPFLALVLAACGFEDPPQAGAGHHDEGQGAGDVDDSDAASAPFARACRRLHGECSALCDNVLVECYDDVATCTEQWKAEYLEDYGSPRLDEELAAECADQVDRQSCTDLYPDTAACDYALVDTCPDDSDAYGAPYSPFTAHPIALGEALDLDLCDGVAEHFVLSLAAGTKIELESPTGESMPFSDLLLMGSNADGDATVERISVYAAMPKDGDYVLELEASGRGRYHVTVAVDDDG